MTMNSQNEIYHHGVKGQRWGVRRSLEELGYTSKSSNGIISQRTPNKLHNVRFSRDPNMSKEEYDYACKLWNTYKEINGLPKALKEKIYEEFDNNLTKEEKSMAYVSRPIGDTIYYAIHKGHNQYKIVDRKKIDGKRNRTPNWLSNVLDEVLEFDWRYYDD